MVLDLKDLAFKEARADAIGEVRLEHTLQQLILAHLNPTQGHQIYSLNAIGLLDALRQLYSAIGSNFAEVMR